MKKEIIPLNIQDYQPRIGLDRVVINNIRIVDIENIRGFYYQPDVSLYGAYKYVLHRPYQCPQYIQGAKISGEELPFTEFVFGHTPYGSSSKGNFTWVEFSAKHIHGTNIYNLSVEECISHMNCIAQYLKSEYGLIIDISDAQYKYMEINTTLSMKEQFLSYRRCLQLINCCVPKSLKGIAEKGNKPKDVKWETYYRCNKSMVLVIYDKTQELLNRHRYKVDLNLLRVEVKLLNAEKIKSSFETNRIMDISSEMIVEYYKKCCIRLIKNPIANWKEEAEKLILRSMNTCRRASAAHWQTDFLEEMNQKAYEKTAPVLLDIEMVYDLISTHQFKTGHPKRLKEQFAAKSGRYSTYYGGDHMKLKDIFEGINEAYFNSKTTPEGGAVFD